MQSGQESGKGPVRQGWVLQNLRQCLFTQIKPTFACPSPPKNGVARLLTVNSNTQSTNKWSRLICRCPDLPVLRQPTLTQPSQSTDRGLENKRPCRAHCPTLAFLILEGNGARCFRGWGSGPCWPGPASAESSFPHTWKTPARKR